MVCVGSGDGPWCWLSGAHLPRSWSCRGQRRGGRQRLWAPEGGAVLLLRPGPDGRDAGGVSGSSASGAEHPAPQSAGASTEEPWSPQVSAASLRTLRSLYLHPSFFWLSFFISDCCAQDCESEKPPRSWHDANTRGFIYKLELVSKYTRQSGAGTWTPRWVLV